MATFNSCKVNNYEHNGFWDAPDLQRSMMAFCLDGTNKYSEGSHIGVLIPSSDNCVYHNKFIHHSKTRETHFISTDIMMQSMKNRGLPKDLSLVGDGQRKLLLENMPKPTAKSWGRGRWSMFAGLAVTTFAIFYFSPWHAVFFTKDATSTYTYLLQDNNPVTDQVVRRYNLTVGARWMNLGMSLHVNLFW